MKRYLFKFLVVIMAFTCTYQVNAQCSGTTIILKLDDVRATSNNTYNSSWQRVADSIRSYNINAAMGPVMIDLTKGSQAFKDSLVAWHNSPHFEIWNHGWTHTRLDFPPDFDNVGEFSGTPYQYQKEHFEWGNQAAKDELGITIRTFGAPYNQTDPTFLRVIEESPDTKVWLYCGDSDYAEGMCLFRGSNNKLESSTGVVSFESFVLAYESNTYPYLVLQGHPGQWSTSSFEEFDKVIKYLKDKGDCFMLPYDYYLQEVDDPLVFQEHFDLADSLYIYSQLDKIDASQTCCGELKLKMKAGQTLSASDPLIYKIGVDGAATSLDIGDERKVYIRLRSTDALNLRLDLSDGTNSTNGTNGKLMQSINANTEDWTVYEFVFPDVSVEEAGLNTQQITEIHLYPNPNENNFPGTLYIDYISIGAHSDEEAQCKSDIDRDGCAMMFEEQFDDQKLNIESEYMGVLDTLESGCGELVMSMKEGASLPANAPITYQFPTPIDFTLNPLLTVRLRSTHRFDLRADLSDGTNETNGSNGSITNQVPANTYVWNELQYQFPQLAFSEKNVDSTAITAIKFYLNPASNNFPGTVYVDMISAGKPSGVGNAIGKTEEDSCGIVPVIVEPALRISSSVNEVEIYPNPTASKFTFGIAQNPEGMEVKIMDLSGHELMTNRVDPGLLKKQFDISTLRPGLYIIKVQTDSYSYLNRIQKM